jgi:hypothetical protein
MGAGNEAGGACALMGACPDPYIREKYTREVNERWRGYFERFPKDRYETSVESWRHLQCDNYEFTMKRLREPKPS